MKLYIVFKYKSGTLKEDNVASEVVGIFSTPEIAWNICISTEETKPVYGFGELTLDKDTGFETDEWDGGFYYPGLMEEDKEEILKHLNDRREGEE